MNNNTLLLIVENASTRATCPQQFKALGLKLFGEVEYAPFEIRKFD